MLSLKKEKGKKERKKERKEPPAGLEPATSRLEVWHAIQLRHGGTIPCKGIEPLATRLKAVRSTD